ncbi:putative family 9 glycosyl hydrolase [Violaceomyces palustris]|uniref:Family 9 glycosyl hydrolase n=1 Tax=Violaceomyces palustris TaxID=1673888 RepID=A0ACD0P1Y3_9BASI|nr:putative family 9 glycosyl hydrolase [Violaceomyces palustris]
MLVQSLLLTALSILSLSPASSGTVSSSSSSSPSSSSVNAQYSNLLGDALWFYEAQRSGKLPSDNRVSWRNDSALQDGSDNGLDLSGGYYDAGDYLKATYPLCWTMTSLAWSALSYGQAYVRSGQDAYLDRTLRWGMDWLIRANPDKDTLYVLVGDPDVDNQYWGGDQGIPNPRPSYKIDRINPGTDAFASCSSAFAATSYLYGGGGNNSLPVQQPGQVDPSETLGGVPTIQDADYSSTLLRHASDLWELATTTTKRQRYQVAQPVVSKIYPSTDYQDDLVLSSLWMALATANRTYSEAAETFYDQAQPAFPYNQGPLNWDQKAPALPILASQISLASNQLGLSFSKYQSDSEVWLDSLVSGKMTNTFTTPKGLLWFDGDSDPASLNPSLNSAFLISLYRSLASNPAKTKAYSDFADSQIDYVLGSGNGYNGPFVVGVHPNSPSNPHSAMASGGQDITKINTSPPTEINTLYGALIGGPDRKDRFFDLRDDYPQTEVALDYNAPLVAITLYRLSTSTDDPPYGLPEDEAYPSSSHGLSKGAKIAIAVIVVVVFFSLLGALAWWRREWLRRSYRLRKLGL